MGGWGESYEAHSRTLEFSLFATAAPEATAAQLGALATAKRARGRDWARGPGVRDAVGAGWGCSAPARRSNKPVLPAVSEKLSKTLRSSRIRRRPAASMVAEPVPMVFKTGSSAGARRRSRSRLQVSCRARAYRRLHPLRASGKVKQGKITNEDVLRREVPWSAFKARSASRGGVALAGGAGGRHCRDVGAHPAARAGEGHHLKG